MLLELIIAGVSREESRRGGRRRPPRIWYIVGLATLNAGHWGAFPTPCLLAPVSYLCSPHPPAREESSVASRGRLRADLPNGLVKRSASIDRGFDLPGHWEYTVGAGMERGW
jgi:hypothetical protein